MNEFLSFDKMITPMIIKIIFWIGVVGCVIGGIVTMTGGGSAILMGFIFIIIGPIGVRIWCELLIVLFQIHGSLVDIKKNTEKAPSPLS